MKPWPSAQEDDNLCSVIKRRNLTATIVVGSDRGFAEKVKRCTEPGKPTPLDTVVKYANKWGYAVREYFDEDIPFIAHHSKNAMQGELRKIFGMADAMRPSGPRYGISRAQLEHPKPDLVMWVDGDAFIATKPISLEELVQRACVRAEYPPDYVRIIGNDSGNNVRFPDVHRGRLCSPELFISCLFFFDSIAIWFRTKGERRVVHFWRRHIRDSHAQVLARAV